MQWVAVWAKAFGLKSLVTLKRTLLPFMLIRFLTQGDIFVS